MNHLNTVTSSSFRDGKSTTGRIKARLAEGYSVDDLILVTDYLTAKWLNDPKMCDYLRPKRCLDQRTALSISRWRKNGVILVGRLA
ncbi:conserved phage C-terminal domain-containing protein [Plesiomonas shigelloides subsp. oncorhynchi]|nr:conserved phage C-terminal domain-containing protein [Plesiomonas shigelloides]